MANYFSSRSLIVVAALAMIVGAGSPAMAQRHRGGGHVVAGRGAPRVVGPRVSVRVAPVRFYRPYYTFQPRVRIGAGFFVGFPVAYSYGYYYNPYNPYYYSAYRGPYAYPAYPSYPTYGYPAPGASYPTYSYPQPTYQYPQSPYSSPAPGSVMVQPGQANTGGASFEITPDSAEVLVDGISMGLVSQFSPMSAPLGLTPGHHHVEIRAPGYRTMTFDVDIVVGQVVPFQGTMER